MVRSCINTSKVKNTVCTGIFNTHTLAELELLPIIIGLVKSIVHMHESTLAYIEDLNPNTIIAFKSL